ncbi:hypothetical protein FQZ97_933000 [compost metagenome]
MGAEQQVALVAHSVADLAAEGLAALQHLQGNLVPGVGGVGACRVELHGGEAQLHVLHRAFGGQVRVVVVVFALGVDRVEVGVGTQALVHQAAEQFVDRLVGGLADDVPAGHFQAGNHAHHGQVRALGEAAGVGLAEEALDMVRVLVQQVALEHVLDDRDHGLGAEGGGVDLADAFDAAVGLQLHEQPVHAADMGRRYRHHVGLEGDDLHGQLPALLRMRFWRVRAAITPRVPMAAM